MSEMSSTDSGKMDPEHLSNKAFARRGNQLFEERVKPHVDVEREARKFVVIDIASGDYEVGESEAGITDRLLARRPEAMGRTWLRRVDSTSAHRLGVRFHATETDVQ